jgi:hypothetical protein
MQPRDVPAEHAKTDLSTSDIEWTARLSAETGRSKKNPPIFGEDQKSR